MIKFSGRLRYIDTHAHLYLPQFDVDREQVVEAAIALGVENILLPNVDVQTIDPLFQMCKRFPSVCQPMLGLHPCSVQSDFEKQLAIIKEKLAVQPVVAIGEIGLDLYWDKTTIEMQQKAFLLQVEWAVALQLPIVIHSRDSLDLLLDLLEQLGQPVPRGVFHCFTGDEHQAQRILALGMYMGIGGVITFKKSDALRRVVANIPIENILLETDAPYLTPHPHRSKRNESSYLPLIAKTLADVKSITLGKLAETTTANAIRLFKLPHEV